MDSVERFQSLFRELASARNSEPGWLGTLRQRALERFLERGFPTTKEEEWRFTSVAPITSESFALTDGAGDEAGNTLKQRAELVGIECHELVFVDGRFSPSLSRARELPTGVIATSLASAFTEHGDRLEPVLTRTRDAQTVFFDLNDAFMRDGAFIHVPKSTVVEPPIHLIFVTTSHEGAFLSHPRNVVEIEANAQLRVIETYVGASQDTYFTNAVTEVTAGANATVDHYKIQREGSSALHVASLDFVQERDATVSNHSVSLGARLVRNDIRALLDGEGADTTLNGLYVVSGTQHVDHHTVIDHKKPHGTSRELYKGILDDASTGVFNGRVVVRPNAQKTDSKQTNKNLLLSENALVNTNPQLEIHADDVKCAHGATIGQLDAEALFYLRTRGIGLEHARKILTEGFMADVAERIRIAAVRDAVRDLLFREAA